jgi:hypothetical protein
MNRLGISVRTSQKIGRWCDFLAPLLEGALFTFQPFLNFHPFSKAVCKMAC